MSSPCAPAAGWSVAAAHAADLGEHPLELPQQLERALRQRVGRERVQRREARQARRPLVDLGVVLHGARAERVEAAVDRVVEVRQVDEVADDLRLVELRQRQGLRPAMAARDARPARRPADAAPWSLRRPGRDSSASVGWSDAPTARRGPSSARSSAGQSLAGAASAAPAARSRVMPSPRRARPRSARYRRPW